MSDDRFIENGEGLEIIAPVETLDSARVEDINGFIEIRNNPISKEGVYDYSGAQIKHPDPTRHGEIFKVYRPADELANPECIASFRLLPFVDEHAMLGSEDMGGTPAEKKGVQGVIGENIFFDPPYLRANIKILSESLKGTIKKGKIELSPGYRCKYEHTPGVWQGQHYDAVQRNIRGNHLALVAEGRTGHDVAVLDRMTFTIDTKEIAAMADEKTPESGGLSRIKELIAELKPLLSEQEEASAMLAELGIGVGAGEEKPVTDEELPAEEVTEEVSDEEMPDAEDKCTTDMEMEKAMDAKVAKLEAKLAKLEAGNAVMDSAILGGIADRDALASKLSDFVGTFDHARMTVQQVAEYGVKKLGVPCVKGTERVAVEAYLHGRTPDHKQPSVTMDSKGVDLLAGWKKEAK